MTKLNTTLRKFAEGVSAVMSSAWTFFVLAGFCGLQLLGPKWAQGVLYASNDVQLLLIPLLGLSGALQSGKLLRLVRQIHTNQRQIMGLLAAIEAHLARR